MENELLASHTGPSVPVARGQPYQMQNAQVLDTPSFTSWLSEACMIAAALAVPWLLMIDLSQSKVSAKIQFNDVKTYAYTYIKRVQTITL